MNNDETQLEKAYGMLKLFMEGQTKTHQEIIEALKSLPYVAYIEEISF